MVDKPMDIRERTFLFGLEIIKSIVSTARDKRKAR
jgi:hypothetical protein